MEPRAFSSAPVGTNFLIGGYTYSSGEVSLDPTIPVTDVETKIHVGSVGYSRAFDLQGRSASAAIILPYYDASITGNVGGDQRRAIRSGIGDTRFRLAANVFGSPALSPKDFVMRTPTTTIGVSTTVIAPTGEYDSRQLINIGTNRWAFKPEIGISQPFGDWFFEGTAGVWLFTNNHDFYGGRERKQGPMHSFQLHAGYTLAPGLWLAANANYWAGGQTTIDGVENDDRQSSSRYGLTLSLPISDRFSAKLAWSDGLTTRVGGNFETVLAVLQYRWFDS
jgi:hypothetical protein